MKIDAAKFIADMIKVHGGECPKVWQDALAMQGLKVENEEIVRIRPGHKFKVGDTIRSKKHGNKYIETIKAVLNDAYLFTDEKVLSFEFEDKWELVDKGLTEFEQCLKSGTNIYVEQDRYMESWDAKVDAKELLAIINKEHEAELERAYKNQDDVVFQRGYEKGYEFGREEKIDNLISKEDIEHLVADYRDGLAPALHEAFKDLQTCCYEQGINDIMKFIKGKQS